MIVKKRKIPLRVEQNEALLRRLPKHHFKRKDIEEDLARRIAGFRGEESLDYYLRFLPRDKFLVLHDTRLSTGYSFFQIDTLILSKNVFIPIEVKNIAGTLTFDERFNQFIRTLDGKEERFANPLAQVSRQQNQLKNWLISRKLISPNFPLVYLVTNSNQQSIIKTTEDSRHIAEKVIHVEYIVDKIIEIEMKYSGTSHDKKSLKHIGKRIADAHEPLKQTILEQYQLKETDILRGVQCTKCLSFEVEKKRINWKCTSCGHSSRDLGKQAVKDYLLVVEPTISNGKCREFLGISSIKNSYRLLKSMELSESGSFKNRRYHLPNDN